MGLRLLAFVTVLAQLPVDAADLVTGRLQTQYLQPDTTYVVGIAPNLPTTVMFPAPGLGFQGVGLMRAADTVAQPVQIEHAPGSNYFTVRAVMPDARSDLNVIFEGRLYAFVFVLSDEPVRGLTLLRGPPGKVASSASRTLRVSVARLVEILDEAKAYAVIAGAFPGYQRNIASQEKGYRIPYPEFDVLVEQAWRFEEEDTIVLRCVFLNRTSREVYYRPDAVAVKVGERTFYCSIADAAGRIPSVANAAELAAEEPKADEKRRQEIRAAYQRGQAVAYFAITGNPDGTRANVSLRNNFNLLVVASERP